MRLITEALAKRGAPVNVALIGCGWWGSGVAKYLFRTDNMHPRLLLDKDIEKCLGLYRACGISRDRILVADSPKALDRTATCSCIAMADISLLETRPKLDIDVIHESTGEVLAGAQTALFAIENRIPFTTVNSEMDATVGLVLAEKARQAQVIYTNTDGDQPGCLARMLDDITRWGFEPVIVGNNKLFLDHYQTPEGVLPWVPKGGNPHMMSAAADGSKLSLELCVVANAYNYPPLKRGMYGPEIKKPDIIKTFDRLAGLSRLNGGHIDYTLGSTEPDMGGPVFVIARTDDPRLKAEMKHYKKGSGPFYLFFRDHHLGSIEAPATIAEAVLFNSAALSPRVWCADTIPLAKKDLPAGKKLDLMGGCDYYGLAEKVDSLSQQEILPIGLAEYATLKQDIQKDRIITRNMVDLEDNLAVRLRKEQDRMVSAPEHPNR